MHIYNICMYIYINMNIHMHLYRCIYIYIYIYIYMYVYIINYKIYLLSEIILKTSASEINFILIVL